MSKSAVPAKKTFDVADVAARLGLSVGTVRYLVRKGRLLPPMRFCRRLLWDAAAFEGWVADQQKQEAAHAQA